MPTQANASLSDHSDKKSERSPQFHACAGCGNTVNLAFPYLIIDPEKIGLVTHLSDACYSAALKVYEAPTVATLAQVVEGQQA